MDLARSVPVEAQELNLIFHSTVFTKRLNEITCIYLTHVIVYTVSLQI